MTSGGSADSAGSGANEILRSLRHIDVIRPERVLSVARPSALVLVGGTCAGKSTVARAIASDPRTADEYEVAARVTTRPRRDSDELEDLSFLTWEAFDARRRQGDLALSWVRPLRDGRSIGYGCERVRPEKIGLHLAGHGVYSNRGTVAPTTALDRSLLIGVLAPEAERYQRVLRRSADLVGPQLDALMAHDDQRMLGEVDVVIRNSAGVGGEVAREVVALAALIAVPADER